MQKKRIKSRLRNNKLNKSKFIFDMLSNGEQDIYKIKKELDFITGGDEKIGYIKKRKSEFFKQFKNEVVDSLPKVTKEKIKESLENAIYTISQKTQDITDEKVIGDLFKQILIVGGKDIK